MFEYNFGIDNFMDTYYYEYGKDTADRRLVQKFYDLQKVTFTFGWGGYFFVFWTIAIIDDDFIREINIRISNFFALP